jgi:hypothetical protein
MAWTLIVIWFIGSSAGQNLVVQGLPTQEACERLRVDVNRMSSFSRCVETVQ